MKSLIRNIVDVTLDLYCSFVCFIKSNLVTFANVLNLILPYIMYFEGQRFALEEERITVGIGMIIPLIFILIIYYFKSIANKIGKGITVPVPNKRFTEVSDDGEVSIEQSKLQELILYVADLEDWLEKKGLL